MIHRRHVSPPWRCVVGVCSGRCVRAGSRACVRACVLSLGTNTAKGIRSIDHAPFITTTNAQRCGGGGGAGIVPCLCVAPLAAKRSVGSRALLSPPSSSPLPPTFPAWGQLSFKCGSPEETTCEINSPSTPKRGGFFCLKCDIYSLSPAQSRWVWGRLATEGEWRPALVARGCASEALSVLPRYTRPTSVSRAPLASSSAGRVPARTTGIRAQSYGRTGDGPRS